ncbi:hypothetical protein [Lutibacter sp.]|uniref:hypothetical protein n=1 Tax=Lutibacter sp. TaxID=1925666 RepID=UPI001A2BAFC8|nr:hypothetical protein [Lutibacter sp.]MBI9041680.1 hypothetical protein [Lutibacter sp.]
MNTKKIFSLLLVIFGEALLILCFLHFGRNVQTEILTLTIVVSTITYSLLFIDIFVPWVNFKDKSQKTIGSIGLRWFFTFFYMLLAIGAMIVFNSVKPIHFTSQIIIQGILFFFLLIGFFLAFSSSDKIQEVYVEEKLNRDRIDEMKKATKEVQLKIDQMKNIPMDIINKLKDLQENLRFLSPSNNRNANELEAKFVEEMRVLNGCFFDIPLDLEKINDKIQNCNRTLIERKQVFSN